MLALLAMGITVALAQPFAPGQGVLPSGQSLIDCFHRLLLAAQGQIYASVVQSVLYGYLLARRQPVDDRSWRSLQL